MRRETRHELWLSCKNEDGKADAVLLGEVFAWGFLDAVLVGMQLGVIDTNKYTVRIFQNHVELNGVGLYSEKARARKWGRI